MAVASRLRADRRPRRARCLCRGDAPRQDRHRARTGGQAHPRRAARGRNARHAGLPQDRTREAAQRDRVGLRPAHRRADHAGGDELRRGGRGGRAGQARHATTDARDDERGHHHPGFDRSGGSQGAARRKYLGGVECGSHRPVAVHAEREPCCLDRTVRRYRPQPAVRPRRSRTAQEPATVADRRGTDQPAGPCGAGLSKTGLRRGIALCQGDRQRRRQGGGRSGGTI